MKRVERSEILDLGEYEQVRAAFRARIIELKRKRRLALGSNMTLLFENHDTVLFQIQEMLRTERITREDAVAHEIETYNELVPASDELSATVFIEYPDVAERDRMLVKLAGIEDRFYIEIDGVRVSARNETRGTSPERTTAVQYVKFPLPKAAVEALESEAPPVVVLGVDHAAYSARAEASPEVVAELRADLTG